MIDTGTPTNAPATSRGRGQLTLAVKTVLTGILILVLLIPLAMVDGLVDERSARKRAVEEEIGQHWGGQQVLLGPVLTVDQKLPNDRRQSVHFLPERLDVDGSLAPETRSRGLFSTVVYRADLTLAATWDPVGQLGGNDELPAEFDWGSARLTLALADSRGLDAAPKLTTPGISTRLEAGAPVVPSAPGGVTLHLDGLSPRDDGTVALDTSLRLAGTRSLSIIAVGFETEVDLASTWSDPSFVGSALPAHHEVGNDGFVAHWEASSVFMGLPSGWRRSDRPPSLEWTDASRRASLGVDLIEPVDGYRLVERALKYGILFIGLTYVVFLLFELFGSRRVHPIPYLLVGCALALFYLLLLSISEQAGFDLAYVIAAMATVPLIGLYCRALLGGNGALTMSGVLTTLYSWLWVVLQQEELALLSGSIGLFATLATIMYLTRRVDWYSERIADSA